VVWFRYNAVSRRWLTHMCGGLLNVPKAESEYYEGFEAVRKAIPPEDLFEWDMKKHTMADLCNFLGVDLPECRKPGTLPKGINVMYIEREQWKITLSIIPLYLFLHWANWRIVGLAWRTLTWPVRRLLFGGKPKAE